MSRRIDGEAVPVQAISAVVRGIVQGVGYRYAAERKARQLGLAGWVRNEPDGSVRAWAQGSTELVAQFSAYLEQGPRGAVVASIAVEAVEPDPSLVRFEVRF